MNSNAIVRITSPHCLFVLPKSHLKSPLCLTYIDLVTILARELVHTGVHIMQKTSFFFPFFPFFLSVLLTSSFPFFLSFLLSTFFPLFLFSFRFYSPPFFLFSFFPFVFTLHLFPLFLFSFRFYSPPFFLFSFFVLLYFIMINVYVSVSGHGPALRILIILVMQ